MNVKLSDFWENLGFAPPMGSKCIEMFEYGEVKTVKTNLNAGNGDPCAGQRRAKLVETVSENP